LARLASRSSRRRCCRESGQEGQPQSSIRGGLRNRQIIVRGRRRIGEAPSKPAWLQVPRVAQPTNRTARTGFQRFNTGSVIEKSEITQSTPAKLLVGRAIDEPVQVTHHDRELLHLRELGKHIPNLIGLDSKHTFGRSTIIAEINAKHRNSPKSRVKRHSTECLTTPSPEWVKVSDALTGNGTQ
jgi:hypothetical protein